MSSYWVKCLLSIVTCAAVTPALAIQTTWTGTTSSDVADASNWSDGVPTGADEAILVTAPNSPDLLGNAVTWGKLTLNGATSIDDSIGGGQLNLSDAGTSLFSGGAHTSTINVPLNVTGNIQTNGDHSVDFNSTVNATKIESFGGAIARYFGEVTISDQFFTIGATAEVQIHDVLNWNFVGEKGFNGGGSGQLVLGPTSDVNAGLLNVYGNSTVRTDGDFVLDEDTDLWGRHALATLDLNGFSQAPEFIATNGGSAFVIDFGATPGANMLNWQASHNSNGIYFVENFEPGIDTLQFGEHGADTFFNNPAKLSQIYINNVAYSETDPGNGMSWWNTIPTPDPNDNPMRTIAVFHTPIPEPASLLMAGSLILALGVTRRVRVLCKR